MKLKLTLLLLFGLTALHAASRTDPLRLSIAEYEDRVHAAWLGQIIGTLAGAQFEGKTASSPLVRVDEFPKPVRYARTDDDYYYELVALRAFEKYGIDLTIDQLGQQWKDNSAGAWGSSNQTRLQLAKGIPGSRAGHPQYNRLWWTIGPQFSADTYGMLAPGYPNLAGELARKYGHINGYAEGTDGAVFVAGMVSMAFRETDPKAVVRQAAQLIHGSSPYRQCLDMVIAMAGQGAQTDDIYQAVEDKWRHVYPVMNNAVANGGLVAASVWFGGGDFLQSINLAYRAADFADADCNGANVGAVIGAMKGTKALPAALVAHLQDRIVGAKMGSGSVELTPPVDESISDIARRVVAVGRKLLAARGASVSDSGITVPFSAVATQPAELFRPSDFTQFWNPEWALVRAGHSGTYIEDDVLATFPRDQARGALLRRRVILGADPRLEIEVAADPGRAWQLDVFANNTKLLDRRIEGSSLSGQREWQKIEVDLSEFRGQEIDLRLYQRTRGFELSGSAYWRTVRVR